MNNFLSLKQIQKKKIQSYSNSETKLIKIEIPAGNATITPPLGPLLGQYGINTMEFCKEFNEETKLIDKDTIIPINLYLANDKSYFFELKIPGIAYFLKKYIESKELSKENLILDKKDFLKFVYKIVILKLTLYSSFNVSNISVIFIKKYISSIIGVARSFGIKLK